MWIGLVCVFGVMRWRTDIFLTSDVSVRTNMLDYANKENGRLKVIRCNFYLYVISVFYVFGSSFWCSRVLNLCSGFMISYQST